MGTVISVEARLDWEPSHPAKRHRLVSEQSAATVVASDDVRVVLIQPGPDAAYSDDPITTDTNNATEGP